MSGQETDPRAPQVPVYSGETIKGPRHRHRGVWWKRPEAKGPSFKFHQSLTICLAVLRDLSFFIYEMGLNPTCPASLGQARASLCVAAFWERKAFDSCDSPVSLQRTTGADAKHSTRTSCAQRPPGWGRGEALFSLVLCTFESSL